MDELVDAPPRKRRADLELLTVLRRCEQQPDEGDGEEDGEEHQDDGSQATAGDRRWVAAASCQDGQPGLRLRSSNAEGKGFEPLMSLHS